MRINNKKLDNIISKVLSETLDEKIEQLESKLKGDINELGGMEDAHPLWGKMNLSKMSAEELEDIINRYRSGKLDYNKDIKGRSEPDDEDIENEYDDYEGEGENFKGFRKRKDYRGMAEGWDSEEIRTHTDYEDYNPKKYKKFPIGKGQSKMDDRLLDKLTGSKPEYDDDRFDDLEFVEGKGNMCECGSGMNEGECTECGYKMEGYDVGDINNITNEFDYTEEYESEDESMNEPYDEATCKWHIENFGEDDDETIKKCKGMVKESLSKKQRKFIDKNKNYKIDSEDFEILRDMKKGKKFETKEGKKFPDLSGDGKVTRKDILMGRGVKFGKKKETKEKWEGDVDVEQTGEYTDMSLAEINSAIKKLKTKNDKAKKAGNKVPQGDRTKMSQLYFAKRAKQGWKGKGSAAVKESVQLTQEELIDVIQDVILEQKGKLKSFGKPKGLQKYEQVHGKSGKENKDYLKDVAKKMKDYTKDGSKGGFDMEPKHFPKGNGELAKMKKKAYIPSDAVKDYIDNLTAAGQENLDFDEIHPDEDWMTKNIEGSSMTGNNPEWANADDTGVNKKRNKIRKDNLLAKIKRKAYKRAPQPIVNDTAGEDAGSKLMMKLESKSPKETKKINEEFERIQDLMSYNRKTQ